MNTETPQLRFSFRIPARVGASLRIERLNQRIGPFTSTVARSLIPTAGRPVADVLTAGTLRHPTGSALVSRASAHAENPTIDVVEFLA